MLSHGKSNSLTYLIEDLILWQAADMIENLIIGIGLNTILSESLNITTHEKSRPNSVARNTLLKERYRLAIFTRRIYERKFRANKKQRYLFVVFQKTKQIILAQVKDNN
ncbi:hypothetical protein V1478_002936 [Vespula squamosa]|uniref:Uncharacterized protein n=1 Tax=Vespula squamosa TaxID=30214 RepID=A0ABD2BR93_VESSQ